MEKVACLAVSFGPKQTHSSPKKLATIRLQKHERMQVLSGMKWHSENHQWNWQKKVQHAEGLLRALDDDNRRHSFYVMYSIILFAPCAIISALDVIISALTRTCQHLPKPIRLTRPDSVVTIKVVTNLIHILQTCKSTQSITDELHKKNIVYYGPHSR